MGKDTGLRPHVTLAALLDALEPSERLFITHRLGPHESEAVAEGTVEGLRASRCVEVCGDNIVKRIVVDVDDWPDVPEPVVLVTIGEKEEQM